MAFIHFMYWGTWRGSAPYLWVEQGGIVEPADVLPAELARALQTRLVYPLQLPEGITHLAGWTVLAFADGSAFLASTRLDQAVMAELAAKHFPGPWGRLARSVA